MKDLSKIKALLQSALDEMEDEKGEEKEEKKTPPEKKKEEPPEEEEEEGEDSVALMASALAAECSNETR